MNDELFYGVNPLTISTFRWSEFERGGDHPYLKRLYQKKYPTFGNFLYGASRVFRVVADDYTGEWVQPAYVKIYGADGDLIKLIECRSNQSAKDLKKDLETKLNDFIKTLKLEIK